jgi:uncharacterized protein (DUF2384 family)
MMEKEDDSGGLREATTLLRRTCRDDARVATFMARPHPLLGGQTPADVACAGPIGSAAVLQLVLRAQAGVAV